MEAQLYAGLSAADARCWRGACHRREMLCSPPRSPGHISRSPEHLEGPLLSSVPNTADRFRNREVDLGAHSFLLWLLDEADPTRAQSSKEGASRVFSALKQITNS